MKAWGTHINKIICKCEKAERNTLLMIYHTILRSTLDYGCLVLGSAADSTLSKLNWVQTKTIRTCCSTFRMMPILTLLVGMRDSPGDTKLSSITVYLFIFAELLMGHVVDRVGQSPESIVCASVITDPLFLRDGNSRACPDHLLECLGSKIENMGCHIDFLWTSWIEGN